ncbi:MAG: hypothetical protein NUV63_12755 [Gallionella sp.]|nr:hypothetical protein [Gallionella sp.]
MNNHPSEASFLKDVANHEMRVVRDDGLHRHVRFKEHGSCNMHFDLITWPGYLCYCGDMGTYVFRRLEDMFQFFRTDREHKKGLGINLSYWSEKLVAVDGGRNKGCAKEFDKERFERVICEYRIGWIRENRERLSKAQRRELWEAVRDDVLYRLDDGEHEVQQAAHDFSHTVERYGRTVRFEFNDLWDHDFTDYTYHFVWCCYALAWGIKQYDEARALDLVATS